MAWLSRMGAANHSASPGDRGERPAPGGSPVGGAGAPVEAAHRAPRAATGQAARFAASALVAPVGVGRGGRTAAGAGQAVLLDLLVQVGPLDPERLGRLRDTRFHFI